MYKNLERRRLSNRGTVRTFRHGNWRQVYVDCLGMCVAQINGSGLPCGAIDFLELHEAWGESNLGENKFQQRILLCSLHHALIEDRAHQAEFILGQYRPSVLPRDIALEIAWEGGYAKWVAKWKLDISRGGCNLFNGPCVEDLEDPLWRG